MNPIPTITISAMGGNVTATVSCPKFPQSIAGVIWRYNADQSFDQKAGTFKTDAPDIDLGTPATINGKFFLVEGTVLNQNDNPPTPYEVSVTITQDGQQLSSVVPSDGGAGNIGTQDIPFLYKFNLVAK
jgi:hypothetical protein